MKPTFFSSPPEWRSWLKLHHAKAQELWVGFYKKSSCKPSLTWPESVDEALCFGWIDGIRKSIDEISYAIRFTPRKPRSTWSAVNIKRVGELTKLKRMQPAGRKAFQQRTGDRSEIYAYEQRKAQSSMPLMRSSSALTRLLGISSRPAPPGIDEPPVGGSSPPKKKKLA